MRWTRPQGNASRLHGMGFPLLSGALLLLCFPPLHLLVPPLVALVPWAVWLHGLPGGREGARSALRGGLLLGGVYFGGLLYWVAYSLLDYSWVAPLGYLGIVGVLTLVLGGVSWAGHRIHHTAGVPLWLTVPLVWTGGEWVQAHLGDLDFPWLGLGTSLTGFPELVGVAELVGARGVTFWLAAINGLGAALVVALGRTSPSGHRLAGWQVLSSVLALVMTVPAFWGVWRASTLELVPVAQVAVAQPGISQELKRQGPVGIDSTLQVMDAIFESLKPGSVDLVVWPEVALMQPLGHPAFRETEERVARFSSRVGAPVVLGAFGAETVPEGEPIFYNSAFRVDPWGLDPGFRYDKRHLVFLTERTPSLIPGRIRDLLAFLGLDGTGIGSGGVLGTRGMGEGTGLPLTRAGDVTYGVVICFESAFAPTVRGLRREGAQVLLNLTNDAWFGGEPWYTRTTAIWQHPAHLVMRAIENRIGVARAANTGISLFVDPLGRVHGALPFGETGYRSAQLFTTGEATLYTRTGDVVGWGASLSVLLLLLASVPVRKARPERPG
ncbi:MAG: apolipoprotein N-acyltransferase [Gemmatimonadota bacterium]